MAKQLNTPLEVEEEEVSLEDLHTQNVANQTQEPSNSPMNNFKNALVHFGPMIGAGLGAGLFGGEDAALAGVDAGSKLRQSMDSADQQAFDNNVKVLKMAPKLGGPRKVQKGERNLWYKKPDGSVGKPIFDETQGWVDENFQPLPGEQLFSEVQERFGESIDLRQKKHELSKTRFDWTRDEKDELSDKQVSEITLDENTLDLLDQMKEWKKSVNTGPAASRAQSISQLAGQASEEFTSLKAASTEGLANYVKSISGAQVTDAERKWLMGAIPNINDDDKTFENKRDRFEKRLKEILVKKKRNIKELQGKKVNSKSPLEDIKIKLRAEKNPRRRLELLRQLKGRK